MSHALHWLDSLQGSGIRPGLGRMRAILRALRHPERDAPSIIVAGTNGKGSTSATLASILTESGYRTGLYTSPHLVDLRERWRIDGHDIDPAALDRAIDTLRNAVDRSGILPTYFEALTLIAFIAFRDTACDVVVLEVGMGGRLDATNVVRPLAAIITPVDFDHTEFLGNTIRKIAREKAGVIHRNAIVLTSNDEPKVLDVLRRRAAQFGNRFVVVDCEHATPLRGDFQRRNVALAARAAEELRGAFPHISGDSIERGIAKTCWRGRLEKIDAGGPTIWVDGFHNPHAAAAIAPFIERNVPAPRLLVFGMMRDKRIEEVARVLFPLFDRIITTEPYRPRSAPAAELAAMAHAAGREAVAEPEPSAAFARALRSDCRSIVIGGSLYLAGAAIAYLDQQGEQQHG
ncbi:MAG TPA: folylpolyglutamate synthase/dihydrofolate synthase family protein [Thermoanaerobaculia bacterium]|nr:folylpolyglutamate synthase/dihydrofolate synthase family protein [Thermoanaerobaculia bacterium]